MSAANTNALAPHATTGEPTGHLLADRGGIQERATVTINGVVLTRWTNESGGWKVNSVFTLTADAVDELVRMALASGGAR